MGFTRILLDQKILSLSSNVVRMQTDSNSVRATLQKLMCKSNEPAHDKTFKMDATPPPAKIQISLGIRPVLLVFAVR